MQSTSLLFNRLWLHISARRRLQFSGLLVLMVLASLAEVIGIGSVIPFLAVLTAPNKVFDNRLAQPLVQFFGITSAEQLFLPLMLLFGAAVTLAAGMRLSLLWVSNRLSFAAGADLSIGIYRRTLYQPYTSHISRNSSEVISGITTKADGVIYNAIAPMLTLLSSMVMLCFILVALIYIDPTIAVGSFLGFGLIYAFIIKVTRKQLLSNGQKIARESTSVIKSLQEGLGGIRDILIDGNQEAYCRLYRNADQPLRRAQGNNFFIAQSPRYVIEALGMLLIAGLAYALNTQQNGISSAIPVLGVLALGAQRLLPLLQQAYSSWTNIQGGKASLQATLDLLDQPLPSYLHELDIKPLVFSESIALRDLSFRYNPDATWIFRNLNLDIKKGSRIGFVGKTGSGKSTLIDIVMGLLDPTEGLLLIDGKPITSLNKRSWQAHIAHVPQSIFLTDGTIAENIAFGVQNHEIDYKRVKIAAQQAQISEVIEQLPLGYQALVGERGVRLSGGQRQRIGIARALYKKADVIIFDEATSALDNETEEAVINAIEGLGKELTLMIIAHRLTTLRGCSQIVELGRGGVLRVSNFSDISAVAC
jgi:ATP-binding cassette, subfamily B, bacterial PglK